MQKRRFVILDRDGTINVDRHYLSAPDKVELLPGAARGLLQLKKLGLGLVVITNQSGIGRGFFNENQLEQVHHRFKELLSREGVFLDGIYVCPHLPEDGCGCRKGNSGLVEQAARELHFILSESFVIGDKESDIELGKKIGSITFLVQENSEKTVKLKPDYVVKDLEDAAKIIRTLL